ncbi:MAG: S-layer homology domain-containing protein [Acidimicrobiia bacterium]|nr:S-layer homology domain-containing protein [Acidimicrobiia bacterium]
MTTAIDPGTATATSGGSLTPNATRRHRTRVLTVVAALLLSLVAAQAPATADEARSSDADVSASMLKALNDLRTSRGVPAVRTCPSLDAAARSHGEHMRSTGVVSHTGAGGSTFFDRVVASGFVPLLVGENLAGGHPSIPSVFSAWMASGTHRANILDARYTHVGSALVTGGNLGTYWVQTFAQGACPDPFGSLDLAEGGVGTVRVRGWAIDPHAGTNPIDVRVEINGIPAAVTRASLNRPDVGAAYPSFGAAHGFDHTFATPSGSLSVCVTGLNVGAGRDARLGCRAVWVADPASPYLDVLSSSPFFDDIVWLSDEGIGGGFADGTFRPTAPTTRQAMASFLWQLSGAPNGPFPDPGFSDVGPTHPFAVPIAWMVDSELATGYADGSFRPTATVSRQATAAFLWRIDGEAEPNATASFSDVGPDHPFLVPIEWTAAEGIAQGDAGGTFRPGDPVSRQAAAAFLRRFSDR